MKTKNLNWQCRLIIGCLLILSGFSASAYDFSYKGIHYNYKYGELAVAGAESSIQDVIIPSQVEYKSNKYLVTSIEKRAFENHTDITSVKIPETITSIGEYAFNGHLNSVHINSLELWCKIKFGNDYANPLRIADHFFVKEEEIIDDLTIPDSVTYIEDYAFYGCKIFKSISIPNSVVRIGREVFEFCRNISSITIGNSLTSIPYGCFKECSSLRSVTIPNSVTSIGYYAFEQCTSLTSVAIPNSVTEICDNAFSLCSSLESLTIPSSIIKIESAFTLCDGLKEIIIEDGTAPLMLDYGLFGTCPLETIYIGRDITYNNNALNYNPAFYNQKNLKSITIGNLVSSINNDAFQGCDSLTSLIIGESVTSIGGHAFEGCSSLCSLTIPESVTKIGYDAFTGCNGLKELIMEDGNETLLFGDDGFPFFKDCPLETIYLGRNLSTLRRSPFRDMQNLMVSIGKPVTSLDKYLFETCNIKSIAFYSFNINGIEYCGFDKDTPVTICTKSDFSGIGNTNLTYFKKITVIKDSNSYGLVRSKVNLNFSKYLYAEGDLYIMPLETCHASWTDTAIKTVFRGEEITDILNNPNGFDFIPSEYHYDNYFGVYGSPNNPSLVKVIELESAGSLLNELELNDLDRIESLIIKGNIDGTDIMTINRMSNLKYLDISNANIVAGGETYRDNLKTENDVIGTRFFDDINLELLYLPNSVKTISDMAFYDMPFYYGAELCSGDLRCIRLGNSINTIGNMAFWGCSGLTSVNVPKTVVAIGSNAFLDCTRLAAVNIDDLESWCKIDFQNSNANPLSYAHHLFLNGEEVHDLIIPSSIVSIKDNAFVGCSGLTSLSLPNTVVSIGDNAFCGTSIKEVLLTSSVKKIGYRAFGSNTDITKVVSLNPTPPEIDPRTFDSKVLESATLYVPRGSLMLYFIDPVWKEFKNISDYVLCLQAIPNARYGDGEIDLSKYAPEGVALTYQSSNEDVVRINGSSMRIVGAGEATVAAILDEDGTTTELVGQLRSIFVDKADLTVSIEEIVIEEGSPIPDFTYIAEGLQYDDTLDDIDNLPQPIHEVDEHSPVGEYAVTFTDGSDRNYRIATNPSRITVTPLSGVKDNMSDAAEQDIEVYNIDGQLIYRGSRRDAILQKGIYIVCQGNATGKITVR